MGTRTSFVTQNRVLRSQTKTTVYPQSGTMCTCHHSVHAVNTHWSIPLLSPTAVSTIQAQSLLHFETGAMGSSPRLGICSKFRLQYDRIYRLHIDDTAFCRGWADRLGLGSLVLGFSVPYCYLSLYFRDLWVATIQWLLSMKLVWTEGVLDPE